MQYHVMGAGPQEVHLQLLHIWPGSAENSLPREAGGVCCSRASQQIPEALPGDVNEGNSRLLNESKVTMLCSPKASNPPAHPTPEKLEANLEIEEEAREENMAVRTSLKVP
ncbi:Sodium Bicarbonate Cotransporter 3 [Manis pentadactyla]|nr:Sodium Bicarbonate Cotransporter 3 [Manis pentadactyla]